MHVYMPHNFMKDTREERTILYIYIALYASLHVYLDPYMQPYTCMRVYVHMHGRIKNKRIYIYIY